MLIKRIGIDLGTANSLIYVAGVGIVFEEPTVVAVSDDGKVVAVGNEAKTMLGRTPGNITALRPMRDGVIADYSVTRTMLAYFIDRAVGRNRLFKPELMICVPSGCTQVERRAVIDAAMGAGAKTVYLIEEPLAAAIGAQIPIAEASGNLIVDSGGGSTEAAIISLGGVVAHASVRVAGNRLDEAITTHMRKKHNLAIGYQTAENIKVKLGSALLLPKPLFMEVKGRDLAGGLPRLVEISSTEIREAIDEELVEILGAVKSALEQTPPELASDIIEKGIVLSGGTCQLANFDRYITQETGVPAHVAEDPLYCVVRGTGVALENIDLYKQHIGRA
ncbi:rod shape-determining protein [Candidatus Roizmanbacteria bacterium CG22_combo_CG10-13_8_21_14_all_38_20]|uniref:Cell shape-determining protein MreB n=1 Tax=Candidatus Roizmanbacteria bacterium CG22_combo_CG10-13_8_21_14_all_38_20 TaxID=1974862 RepID=A0A2H0BVX9_9BACT|nr:MAG: rod shape-determining protein [Candidatus Roizmanbacteria bacterium CG22_combo_CG10-13_8_21_14_all_38_20]PJC30802.1 MAG: rod shape-determining protein [Candidatus Roizmanbacteria bacterium CG_4_9_14_0_2_um_filter_38_17]